MDQGDLLLLYAIAAFGPLATIAAMRRRPRPVPVTVARPIRPDRRTHRALGEALATILHIARH